MATGRAATETAVIVAVAAAEPVVSEHRSRFDPSSRWGVPAHVTVLYPFVHPDTVDDDVVLRLGEAVGTVRAFDCSFVACSWFGEDVLWLRPDPDGPFRSLTATVWRAFPDHPPYGGAHPDVVPHLTIGERSRAGPGELSAVERVVSQQLPVATHVDRVQLIAGTSSPHSWRTIEEFPLVPAR